MGGKERVHAGERVQRGVPEDVCRIREDCRVQAEDTVSERLMDSKSIGLCPQGFESPRCRLQGWREATENSWRLVGGCEALLAPEEVAPEETVSKWLVRVLSEEKKCGSLEPSPLNYCQTRKSCGVLERQHPLWDSSPQSSD